MGECNTTESGHNNHEERGRVRGKEDKKTKEVGKICHYPQRIEPVFLPGLRDSFGSSTKSRSKSNEKSREKEIMSLPPVLYAFEII